MYNSTLVLPKHSAIFQPFPTAAVDFTEETQSCCVHVMRKGSPKTIKICIYENELGKFCRGQLRTDSSPLKPTKSPGEQHEQDG